MPVIRNKDLAHADTRGIREHPDYLYYTPERALSLIGEVMTAGAVVVIAPAIINEIPFGDIDGVNQIFSTFHNYQAGSLAVYLNGLRQRLGVDYDYQEIDPATFTFNTIPQVNDFVVVDYLKLPDDSI